MYRAFQHFDTDNSGTISQAELREALRVRHLALLAVHRFNLRHVSSCIFDSTRNAIWHLLPRGFGMSMSIGVAF